jgi:segregation and condensation protein B
MTPMNALTLEQLESIIEAALMVAGQPLTVAQIQKLFSEEDQPSNQEVREALEKLQERYNERGIELHEVASGFQFQAKVSLSPWLSKLWEERPPRYSRAFLETLAIIAYRQPVTRAEIEDIRGVSVSSSIFKTLLEREWIRLVGYKDVPGKPAIYGTTKTFLDHFNLKSLRELPTLAEIQDMIPVGEVPPVQLAFDNTIAAEESAIETESQDEPIIEALASEEPAIETEALEIEEALEEELLVAS